MSRRKEEDGKNERIADLVISYEASGPTTFLDEDAYHDLIEYYQNEEQFEKALEVARHACSQYRFSTDFYVRQAQLLMYTNRTAPAREVLEKALHFAPGDFELNLLLAETFIRQGDYQAGLARLAPFKLQVSQEELSDILLVESLVYERRSEYELMFYALKASLEADWSNERALERLSLCTEFCRKHTEACTLYQHIIDEDPYNCFAWYYLGQSLTYLGKKDDAIEAFEYAFLTEPEFEQAYLDYAELCLEQRYFSKALDAFQEMCERFGVDGYLLMEMGTCYQLSQQYESARAYFEQTARIEPHNDEAFAKIGECYAAQEKWAIALSFFQKAIRLNPQDEMHYLSLAEAAFATKAYEAAEVAYKKALELSPDDSQLWLDLAWFYLEMLRPAEALETLKEANECIDELELAYSYTACLIDTGHRQEGLSRLADLLTTHYPAYTYLFEWQPSLRADGEVMAMIQVFRPEAEG